MLYHSGLKKMQQEEVSLDSFYSGHSRTRKEADTFFHDYYEITGRKTSLQESKSEVLCNRK
jgi:hypothetical protein